MFFFSVMVFKFVSWTSNESFGIQSCLMQGSSIWLVAMQQYFKWSTDTIANYPYAFPYKFEEVMFSVWSVYATYILLSMQLQVYMFKVKVLSMISWGSCAFSLSNVFFYYIRGLFSFLGHAFICCAIDVYHSCLFIFLLFSYTYHYCYAVFISLWICTIFCWFVAVYMFTLWVVIFILIFLPPFSSLHVILLFLIFFHSLFPFLFSWGYTNRKGCFGFVVGRGMINLFDTGKCYYFRKRKNSHGLGGFWALLQKSTPWNTLLVLSETTMGALMGFTM
jgi:hypothetical protein